MAYGDKRDHRKIDLYVRPKGEKVWAYAVSTTWAKTCREAVEHFQPDNGTFEVKATFAPD